MGKGSSNTSLLCNTVDRWMAQARIQNQYAPAVWQSWELSERRPWEHRHRVKDVSRCVCQLLPLRTESLLHACYSVHLCQHCKLLIQLCWVSLSQQFLTQAMLKFILGNDHFTDSPSSSARRFTHLPFFTQRHTNITSSKVLRQRMGQQRAKDLTGINNESLVSQSKECAGKRGYQMRYRDKQSQSPWSASVCRLASPSEGDSDCGESTNTMQW